VRGEDLREERIENSNSKWGGGGGGGGCSGWGGGGGGRVGWVGVVSDETPGREKSGKLQTNSDDAQIREKIAKSLIKEGWFRKSAKDSGGWDSLKKKKKKRRTSRGVPANLKRLKEQKVFYG